MAKSGKMMSGYWIDKMNRITVQTINDEDGSFVINIVGRNNVIINFTSDQIANNINTVNVISSCIQLGEKHGADALAENLGLIWDNGWVKFEEYYESVEYVMAHKDKDGNVDFSRTDPRLRQLADFLHYQFCHVNHTDGCGYGYYNWNKINPKDDFHQIESITRALYLLKNFNGDYKEIYRVFELFKRIDHREVHTALRNLIG